MGLRDVLQLGFPIGLTLLLTAAFELVQCIGVFIQDIAIVLYYMLYHGSESNLWVNILFPAICKIFPVSVFLWFGVICRGSQKMLLAWIVSNIIFLLVLFIITIVEWSKYEYQNGVGVLYNLSRAGILEAYEILIAVWALQALKQGEILQPLGRGIVYIWEFFVNELHQGAKFFLVAEMMVDCVVILFSIVPQQVIYGWAPLADNHPLIYAEQLVMTGVRLILDSIGLYLLVKEKRSGIRLWCLCSAIQILVSCTLFVLTTIQWRGTSFPETVFILLMYPLHLLHRCIVLYFCLRYIRINFTSGVL